MNTSYTSSDPRDIVLSYTIPGAETPVDITFQMLDSYMDQSIKYGIIYGVGIGAAIVILFMLCIMIKNKKTPMFFLNQTCLVLLIIRCSLYLSYLLGPLASMSFSFTGLIIPETYYTYRVTVAANALQCLLIASIQASLCYQMYVVFLSPLVKKLGIALTAFFGLLSLATFALYLHSTVAVARVYQSLFDQSEESTGFGGWVNNVPFILFSSSINIISLLLVVKLFHAIRTRRYLGLKQFDNLHILLLVSTQTMIIPSILVIVNYKDVKSGENYLATISVILIVLMLPLSSMWAASSNLSPSPSSSSILFLSKTSTESSSPSTAVGSYLPKVSKVGTMQSDFEKVGDLDSHNEIESIERILDNISTDDFKAITAHSLK